MWKSIPVSRSNPPTTNIKADKGDSDGTAAESMVPELTIEDNKEDMSVIFESTDAVLQTRLIVS